MLFSVPLVFLDFRGALGVWWDGGFLSRSRQVTQVRFMKFLIYLFILNQVDHHPSRQVGVAVFRCWAWGLQSLGFGWECLGVDSWFSSALLLSISLVVSSSLSLLLDSSSRAVA